MNITPLTYPPIQPNAHTCRNLDTLKIALAEPGDDEEMAFLDYEETLTLIQMILENGQRVLKDEVWQTLHISRTSKDILHAASTIIDAASWHLPLWDWVETENVGWQMERLRIVPLGLDYRDEDVLEHLEEPYRFFAQLEMERLRQEGGWCIDAGNIFERYPKLNPAVLTTPNLCERIRAIGLKGGRKYLWICAQIGMQCTGNLLLDWSEMDLYESGFNHPEWTEYNSWVREAKQAYGLYKCGDCVSKWVRKNPEHRMGMIVSTVNRAIELPYTEVVDDQLRWERSTGPRW
ncbi:MAG: hypothetical protein AAGD96_11350 [Chloroflexota bacterium]